MNKVLSLTGVINGSKNIGGGGVKRITPHEKVTVAKIESLIADIQVFLERWKQVDSFCNPIVSIRYIRRIPKSLRMNALFKINGVSVNDTIIGASYSEDEDPKHILVYMLPIDVLLGGIDKLKQIYKFLDVYMDGYITCEDMKLLFENKGKLDSSILTRRNKLSDLIRKNSGFSVSLFGQLVQDIHFIESIYLDCSHVEHKENSYVSFYNVGLSDEELLKRLDLPSYIDRIGNDMDGYSYLLTAPQLDALNTRYPYLISMAVSDYSKEKDFSPNRTVAASMCIPMPDDEPIIGVLDGAFDENAYFSDWVEYSSSEMDTDKMHGTAVSSLIVDGPSLNPELEDHCGRFRVKHFNIDSEFSGVPTFDMYHKIDYIIRHNPTIKVWNLSWGTEQEVDRNSVSPVAALLDRLQHEYDIIFIVCGTNNNKSDVEYPYVGSPADSINSLVVNSVDFDGSIPSYSRKGPVLGFYQSPDLCAIGGSPKHPIKVAGVNGFYTGHGTSYAACWITRKIAYLIYRLKFTREEAKALLIDSAYGWKMVDRKSYAFGVGVVPTLIEDVIRTDNTEFKVIIKGSCEMYNTYSYRIPVPIKDGKFPFIAKATLCYFPECCRRQGVDYTSTELDLHFGRLNSTGGISTINNNAQGESGKKDIPESIATKDFGKWDCTKHITEKLSSRNQPKMVYSQNNGNDTFAYWGFRIEKKKRLDVVEPKVNFALVATFRSIDGRNRINEFMQYARANGWLVNEIDIDVMNDIHSEEMEDIEFTD